MIAAMAAVTAVSADETQAPPLPEATPAAVEGAAPASAEATPAESALETKLEGMDEDSPSLEVPPRESAPPIASARSVAREHDLLAQAYKLNGRYVVGKGDAARPLTVDPELQEQLTQVLKSYRVPYGAVVAIDPATGRVLAMAEHSRVRPDLRGLATQALFPAASIFKIVTSAALLAEGVKPEDEECFHGGKRRLHQKLLVDSQRDGNCYSLAMALGKSANVVFGKMTLKHLNPLKLRGWAEALGFNRPLSFDVPTGVSLAAIPEDAFGLASTGAGFGDVYLSPLHGAALAAAVANKGVWRQPALVERDGEDAAGQRVLTEEQARALTEMMEQTVTNGTARRIFRERGHQVKDAVGKTGSLADKNPFRDYSWFVGFAPKDNPKVAVAAVIVNEPLWHIRATYLGREAMRLYLDAQDKPRVRASARR